MNPTAISSPAMRLAVFASGGGSNFQAILDAVAAGSLEADVSLLVSNKATAGALVRAGEHGVPSIVLDPRAFDDEATYETVLLTALAERGVTHIALAGYLRRIPSGLVEAFRGRIVNIHPALLPAYGGPGMYGRHVHRAVIAAGVPGTGVELGYSNSSSWTTRCGRLSWRCARADG